MLKEQLADFFKDLGYILKKIFTSRMVPFAAAGAVLFAILIIKLFNMQIVHGDDYTDSYIMKAEKTVTTTGLTECMQHAFVCCVNKNKRTEPCHYSYIFCKFGLVKNISRDNGTGRCISYNTYKTECQ